jgi:hypothetical protein
MFALFAISSAAMMTVGMRSLVGGGPKARDSSSGARLNPSVPAFYGYRLVRGGLIADGFKDDFNLGMRFRMALFERQEIIGPCSRTSFAISLKAVVYMWL